MIELNVFKKLMEENDGRLPLLTLDEFFEGYSGDTDSRIGAREPPEQRIVYRQKGNFLDNFGISQKVCW